ncbi:ATP-binding cassette domain-containing protein [Frankia sp. CNm7]|uniref:ATP-binding cassette domain-containing protein n=1 Tax=Frankia nepalensis TaxID=1836974 RepID=A0A937RJS7_9ACTN|nr:ATP-binding cassette domain-containing protein [Frankia nepalensis]MBL7501242.1 ATP-binding cassette domain-containing protein [Frankia nepalensis]MBL7509440.1 ATP-binding cassette domain-containing protein [Frankia nepalensis]MBL7523348.1 ATP-binding cassette domain-containing protein [Frankia nepalensis]MBL7631557.1 ATP-binding cassette domain-containing protein [Frankia nepalensis]
MTATVETTNPTTTTTARLECVKLSGGRGSALAFRDVDLKLAPGKVLAVLGPNGAGKTTLLLTLAGLLPSKGGNVLVDGARLRGGRPALASRAGLVLVPDNRCLFVGMSVEDNLKVAAKRGGPKPRELLETFPALERRWDLAAGALSGGEQQMLAMARALIQQPKVLLVDEMSLGLAPLIVEQLFETVGKIARDHGCSVVLVEQYAKLALDAADDGLVLSRGRVVLAGPAGELAGQVERLENLYFDAPEDKAG